MTTKKQAVCVAMGIAVASVALGGFMAAANCEDGAISFHPVFESTAWFSAILAFCFSSSILLPCLLRWDRESPCLTFLITLCLSVAACCSVGYGTYPFIFG